MTDIAEKTTWTKTKTVLKTQELLVSLFILGVFIVMTILSPKFLTKANMHALLLSVSQNFIVAIGMTLLLISGGFDLSVGSVLGFGGVITGIFLNSGIPIVFSIIMGLAACMFFGWINGLFIVKMEINPLITTLGMLSVVRGIIFIFTRGQSVPNLPDPFTKIGQGSLWGVQNPILIMLILLIIFEILIRKSTFFRQYYYIGENEKSAKLAGMNSEALKSLGYIISGALAGSAGIILASRAGGAMSLAGVGIELRVVTAVVIGGASLAGGKGSILGSFLGTLLIAIVINGFNILGATVYWLNVILGIILLAVVIMDSLRKEE